MHANTKTLQNLIEANFVIELAKADKDKNSTDEDDCEKKAFLSSKAFKTNLDDLKIELEKPNEVDVLPANRSESSLSINKFMCRICHCEETSSVRLIMPCDCSGTLRHVHEACLSKWLKISG